jgi:homoserine kinase
MRFRVEAPATSANLGPGFDALGIALDLWNAIEVAPAAETVIRIEGSDGALLETHENLSLTAMARLAAAHGKRLPQVDMTVRADVPVARGLGSSAAAIVAGLLAADRLLGLGLTRREIFAMALDMEGHGDNVGAALYGGAVLAVPGVAEPMSLLGPATPALTAVVFIPTMTGATSAARAVLPRKVSLQDAVFNLAGTASVSVGLLTGNLAAITAGMRDRLHEPYRAKLFPHLEPVADAAREAGAVGACLSGAGPTVLALVESGRSPIVATAMSAAANAAGTPGRVTTLAIVQDGARVIDL